MRLVRLQAHLPGMAGQGVVPDNLRVRVHEAGHAVVAARLGFQIATVSTTVDTRSAGRVVLTRHPAGNKSAAALWAKAIVLAAGAEAEVRILRSAARQGSSADEEELARICRHLARTGPTRRDATELQSKARATARQLVHRHAGRIVQVARRLADSTHMTGAELAQYGELPPTPVHPC